MATHKTKLSEEQIKKLPKADLHVHLDGSVRLATLIELAKTQNVKLPSYTEEGLKDTVFKSSYKNLAEYLQGFQYTCAVMQDKESLERVAYEFAWDCFNEGVIYVEPRYSPELLQQKGLKTEEVITYIDKGLKKAQTEINLSNTAPKFKYCHVLCAMRMWDPARSLQMIIEAVNIKERTGLPIMGIDLAGPEKGYPAVDHQDAYTYAHQHFIHKTVHAGEAFGPPSIFQAISHLYADRIGHGFHLFHHQLIENLNEVKAKEYVNNLVQYIAEKRITLEVCLTSNLQTLPELKNNVKNHSFGQMLENGLSVAVCTDNRTVSNTSVTKELMIAQEAFQLSRKQMKKIIMYGIKRGFYPGNYLEKKQYVDTCSKYYDFLEEQHGNLPG